LQLFNAVNRWMYTFSLRHSAKPLRPIILIDPENTRAQLATVTQLSHKFLAEGEGFDR